MFSAPSRATAAALYHRVEEESNEFSSRLTTHAANSNMSLNRYVIINVLNYYLYITTFCLRLSIHIHTNPNM